ncbi:MAG TPA: hypothetical protein VGJ83_07750 [Gemmatimonadales bacterium]|jgi:hypothetical protein
MSTTQWWTCCLMLSVTPCLSANAQLIPPPLHQGQRVRVTAPASSPARITGTFIGIRSDSVVVAGPEGERAVPRSAVLRLDVSRGPKTNAGTGALIGMGVVGAAGLVACGGCFASDDGGGANFLLVLFPSLAGGALIGVLIGSGVHSDRWEPVPSF